MIRLPRLHDRKRLLELLQVPHSETSKSLSTHTDTIIQHWQQDRTDILSKRSRMTGQKFGDWSLFQSNGSSFFLQNVRHFYVRREIDRCWDICTKYLLFTHSEQGKQFCWWWNSPNVPCTMNEQIYIKKLLRANYINMKAQKTMWTRFLHVLLWCVICNSFGYTIKNVNNTKIQK